jgi:hypothetical protein
VVRKYPIRPHRARGKKRIRVPVVGIDAWGKRGVHGPLDSSQPAGPKMVFHPRLRGLSRPASAHGRFKGIQGEYWVGGQEGFVIEL